MSLAQLLQRLGDPIEAPDEETFDLFAQDLPSQNLGFIDSKASTLDLTIGDRDLTIHQSPGVLASNRAGGTTGAVVWKITPLFAEWISSPSSSSPLFTNKILTSSSHILELGSGISALVGLVLAPRVASYVLTDQPYVSKLIDKNITENHLSPPPRSSSKKSNLKKTGGGGGGGGGGTLNFVPLDWEKDTPTPSLTLSPTTKSFDLVVACDCIYNEALIEPFVATCVDVCRLREGDDTHTTDTAEGTTKNPCICVVAQQLRDPDVFEAWLVRFAASFRVWRVPDDLLSPALRSNSGFVVHFGILKGVVVPE
ncbi:ribosomal lysine N-methyltransferase 5 [Echria macrotheca]|uniref:Ribosomal lysine N-methyltransferase 5 n=1 Tax=Echria macrotheca TaxID=438768 RepID=A0AAJ0FDF5_9PEZI|nr:ribosomal lysine N-methyltransferase 5 [Echria macrotheca]